MITIGMAIVSCAVYFFMIPGNVVAGGISGPVLVLSHFLPLSISLMTFILNTILLILGFIFIGKEFGTKNIYTSILLPLFLAIFEAAFPNQPSLTNDAILDPLCYVLLISFGSAILFNANASSGGLDIVAKLLNKFFHLDLGKALSAKRYCNCCNFYPCIRYQDSCHKHSYHLFQRHRTGSFYCRFPH